MTEAATLTKRAIDLPVDLKKRLAVQATALDMSLNTYVRRALEKIVAEEEDESWLTPYFSEPADYLSDDEAQQELKKLGWK